MDLSYDLPKGFVAGTTRAAFKKADRDDLGIIFSNEPCVLAALFTQNIFAAAPVIIDRQILASGIPVRAIVGNSGQANACTGEQGLKNCQLIQKKTAQTLGIKSDEVLVISTGVIGAQFDMAKWEIALPRAIEDLGKKDAAGFTGAIMTTDSFPKYNSVTFDTAEGPIKLTVMAKGAGMICPNMATMLCVCLTDAQIQRDLWQPIFNRAVQKTFNRITVDGDTSTNDTILGLANGASNINLEKYLNAFEQALTEILAQVAYLLVKDGEGASKVLHIKVTGAENIDTAKAAARAVGNSQLVKTAIYGGDANWGRIITAVGYSGIKIDPAQVSLTLCGIRRFNQGQPINDDQEPVLAEMLKRNDIDIEIILGSGPGEYTLLASDLGHEYVTLNSDYRS